MTAPTKPRRCGCGRPATHRLKGGTITWRMWTPDGVRLVHYPVHNENLCGRHAVQSKNRVGGRVYRWRHLPGAGQ